MAVADLDANGDPKKMLRFRLRASDGTEIIVDEDVAFQSNLLKKMVSDLGIDDPDSELLQDALPVTNLDGWTLIKIMDWCSVHRNETFQPKGEHEDPRVTLTTEDEEYMDMTSDQLLNVLLGANYLDIPGIIEIITQKIANMANGKSVEEIRVIYGLENDFTEEEEETLRRRFEWVEQ